MKGRCYSLVILRLLKNEKYMVLVVDSAIGNLITLWMLLEGCSLEGKHTIVEVVTDVFSVKKLGKIFKNSSTINHKGFSASFNEWSI